ncbi:MAG TPA: hypothetical protein DCW88_23125 [Agrobacterium sp.]|nr:hypothetical protein EGT36_15015 [Agrobacterium sp. FDAARGOS_525]HAU78297.1 hypothetical protein [Agrobacterium sp.]
MSAILKTVPRALKPAGDGEIRLRWQCAGSLPPPPSLRPTPAAGRSAHVHVTDDHACYPLPRLSLSG